MKRMWIVVSLLLVLGLLIGGFGCKPTPAPAPAPAPPVTVTVTPTPTPTPTPVQKMTLKLGTVHPKTGSSAQQLVYWQTEITKRSNGRIQFEEYYGASLFSAGEELTAVKLGVVDVATYVPWYHAAEFPLNQVNSYYFFNSGDPGLSLKVYKAAFQKVPQMVEEYTRQNLKVLALNPTSEYTLQTAMPITTLSEFKGKKIAGVGLALSKFIEAGGGVPIAMPGTDRYVALERATIDGHILIIDMIDTYKLAEVAKHITKFPAPSLGCFGAGNALTINTKTWDKLSDADKKLFAEVGADAEKFAVEYFVTKMTEGYANAIKAGATIHDFDAADWGKWLAATPNLAGNWAKDMEAKGLPGQKIIDTFLEEYAKGGHKSPPGWGKVQ